MDQNLDFFGTRDQVRQAQLMGVLDRLNAEYSSRTVHVSSLGGRLPTWSIRQAFRSPRYTTH